MIPVFIVVFSLLWMDCWVLGRHSILGTLARKTRETTEGLDMKQMLHIVSKALKSAYALGRKLLGMGFVGPVARTGFQAMVAVLVAAGAGVTSVDTWRSAIVAGIMVALAQVQLRLRKNEDA